MRHPGLKLNTPPQVFCMGWCNLTLSSGGYAGDAMKYRFVPVFLEPFVQNEEVRANPSGILFVWWHASACSGILFLWRASACSGTPLCVFGVASGMLFLCLASCGWSTAPPLCLFGVTPLH